MAPSKEEVFDKVREALVDALGVDEDEVERNATMVGDLGAESIDFLDIVFRLEKSFGIDIPRAELFPEDILTNAEYVQDGKVTPAGIEELKTRMPFADLSKFEANPVVQDFGNLLTVNDLCRYIESKVVKLTEAPMRWYWIDRFTEFESGRRAVAVKNVTLAEEHLEFMTPGYPRLPASLVVEGIAQTGGLLVGEHNDFLKRVVLAKLSKATFHGWAQPGDTVTYVAEAVDIRPDGAIVSTTATIDGRPLAEVELVFAHLDDRFAGVDLFFPADFLTMLRVLGLFHVGRRADGQPLDVPAHLLEAESQVIASGMVS